jgi:hypothetical protein
MLATDEAQPLVLLKQNSRRGVCDRMNALVCDIAQVPVEPFDVALGLCTVRSGMVSMKMDAPLRLSVPVRCFSPPI